jgi:hypothetical protein
LELKNLFKQLLGGNYFRLFVPRCVYVVVSFGVFIINKKISQAQNAEVANLPPRFKKMILQQSDGGDGGHQENTTSTAVIGGVSLRPPQPNNMVFKPKTPSMLPKSAMTPSTASVTAVTTTAAAAANSADPPLPPPASSKNMQQQREAIEGRQKLYKEKKQVNNCHQLSNLW